MELPAELARVLRDYEVAWKAGDGDLILVAFAYATSDTVGYFIGGFRYPQTVGPGGKFVLALRRDPKGSWRIAADIENSSESPRPVTPP